MAKPATRQAPPPAAAQQQAPAAAPSRMTVSAIVNTAKEPPIRLMLLGTEGVGKTSFAAQAPKPVFICGERGLEFIRPRPSSFPPPKTWQEVLDCVRALIVEPHEFQTLVIDTLDWIEHLLYDKVQQETKMTSVEMDAFQRWIKVALEDWRTLIRGLEVLQERRGLNIVVLAHAGIGNFRNPAGADYQRFKPKMAGDQPANLWKEWVDAVLFATYELSFDGKQEGMVKAATTGRRLMYTTYTPAHDAKNRWGLPDVIEFNKDTAWADLMYWKTEGLAKGAPVAPAGGGS